MEQVPQAQLGVFSPSSTRGVSKLIEILYICPDGHITFEKRSDSGTAPILCHIQGCKKPTTLTQPRPESYDNSMITDFTTCPRYGYFRHDMGLKPYDDANLAADAGTIWHKLMELYYTQSHALPLDERKDRALRQFAAYVKEHFPRHPMTEAEDMKRSVEHIVHTFDAYVDFYERNPMQTRKIKCFRTENSDTLESAFTEINFNMELSDPPIPDWRMLNPESTIFTGRIDMLAEYAGKLWLVDHKTSTLNNNAHFIMMEIAHQFTGYMLGLQTLLGDRLPLPIGGIIVDCITWNKIITPERDFKRLFIERTPQELQDWHEQITWKINQIRLMRRLGKFVQNTQHCSMFMTPCRYSTICKSKNLQTVKTVIESQYKQEFWDPSAELSVTAERGE